MTMIQMSFSQMPKTITMAMMRILVRPLEKNPLLLSSLRKPTPNPPLVKPRPNLQSSMCQHQPLHLQAHATPLQSLQSEPSGSHLIRVNASRTFRRRTKIATHGCLIYATKKEIDQEMRTMILGRCISLVVRGKPSLRLNDSTGFASFRQG